MAPKNVKGKKGAVTPNNKGKKAKAPPPPPVESESDEDDSDEDDSEEEAPVPVATISNKVAPKRKADSDDDDSDDDDSDDDDSDDEAAMPVVKSPPKKVLKKAEESDDDNDDDDDDDDDDEDDDDDDDDDDDESEEEEAVVKTNGTAKIQAQADDDDDDDDDDDEDDDDDDEDDDDDDDNSEDEEDSDEEEEDTKKRKKVQNNKPAKKAKIEEGEKKATLHVNNVGELADDKVKKIFEKKGISVAEVRRPRPGGRYVYVDLADPSQLEMALKLDGVKNMKVEVAKPEKKTPQKEVKSFDDKNDVTLFVKNLAETVTEDMLQEFFTGSTAVRMPKRFDGNPKGFAYIVFTSADEVETMLSEKQGAELEGNALFLDKAGGKPKDKFGSPGGKDGEKSKVLFVKNLSYSCTEETLKEAFEGCTAARIAKFPDTDKSRGFGFVDFDTVEEAMASYKAMAGQEIDGRQIYLNFAEKGGGRGGGRGGRGGRGGGGRGGGGRGGFRGRGRGGGDRGGFRGRGRGGGGRGKSPSAKGSIQNFEGKKKVFAD